MNSKLSILFVAFAIIGCKKLPSSETVEVDHESKIERNSEIAEPTTPNLKSDPPTTPISKEVAWREWLARRETFRVKIFSIPLAVTAAHDRAEAWDKLAIPDDELRSSSEQLQWARALLDRYANGTQIEKLVFWQLVAYRMSSHYPGPIVRTIGDQGPSMTSEKLEEILYSALGVTPEILPYDQAIAEGLRILEQVAKDPK